MTILWTARAAVACMLVRVLSAARHRRSVPERQECIVWTSGCILFLLHVAAAFQFQHDWSHIDAYRHTAEQTAAITGWHWGGGLYFNYLFTLLWVVDVVTDWRALTTGQTPYPRIQIAIRWFLAFIVINATVVFGHASWWVVLAILGLMLLGIRHRSQRHPPD